MPSRNDKSLSRSRRIFLKQMGWAPVLFLPSPLTGRFFHSISPRVTPAMFSLAEAAVTPHYPSKSPLDDILRFAAPGLDEYVLEGYTTQIADRLREWSRSLTTGSDGLEVLSKFVDPAMQSTGLTPMREVPLRAGDPLQAIRRDFSPALLPGRGRFMNEIQQYLTSLGRIETADFEIYGCRQSQSSPLTIDCTIRYDFVGAQENRVREERIGLWDTRWAHTEPDGWRALSWSATEEILTRAAGPIFLDITSHALGQTQSYKEQLLRGADYWRTIIDGAVGVDVYGNNGVAAGDFDNDGHEDLYVCQPAGLPNRLYRNRGDGTFEDVTEKSGVGVLDFTACALFADFENRGFQDLLVVCATGPLLFRNNGDGTFKLKRDAFHFLRPPQGAFTSAAVADYDRDGRLDIYFCLYSYYQGLDQYRYPVPYFDARNGPPNYLFHNEGNGVFEDRTDAAGLNIENDRYSFACSWGDTNGDGWPDLYVVNDFGRNSLYRNNSDGTFAAVSVEARVNEAGAGMSACWLDVDNSGKQDIYAAGMWVAAGMRVFGDSHFHGSDPEHTRDLYRRHMSGNSLYRNQGDGTFQNVATKAGVENGRWSWSTDSWDFDHDGFPDLYVANGYISGADRQDVSSFFWRQVVAKSPQDARPTPEYERGWSAMNELIRSDSTWNGHERNVFFVNNRNGTFCDFSGVAGLDFRDDSRAFALADLDGDGRLELVLKNRNAPQLRVLRLAMEDIGDSIAIRLRGHKSNRDAIGAAVTVESGTIRQTKLLQAGSGFLSQHTKELFFGLGKNHLPVRATVHWPNGDIQTFNDLPVNHRIEIEEGGREFHAKPFALTPQPWKVAGSRAKAETLPDSLESWLVAPVKAPAISLPDLNGNLIEPGSFQGQAILLNFWRSGSLACRAQLQELAKAHLTDASLRIVTVNVDDPSEPGTIRAFLMADVPFPVLLGDAETTGIYNIIYRYLFDRHRDLPLPASFLIDESGSIVKVYQGTFPLEHFAQDAAAIPRTSEARMRHALPFPGTLHQGAFSRNDFTYGVAFFQRGFLEEATRSFQQVIAEKPDDADAYYNLGTLYLRRSSFAEAQQHLEKALKLRPNYPEAWNNLGMMAAQKGNTDAAINDFQRSLQQRPSYAAALLNLGNVYRRQGNIEDAEKSLKLALENDPNSPEANYGLGMLFARKNQTENAVRYLRQAITLRSNYADALNNLGVLFVQAQRYSEAEEAFETCIAKAPDFDQAYLNLARLYLVQNQKEKARTALESLLKKQPQHKMAQQMMQMLY